MLTVTMTFLQSVTMGVLVEVVAASDENGGDG